MDPELQAKVNELAAAHPELEIRQRQKATPRQRVVIWIVGSVLAALLPIVMTALHGVDTKHTLGLYQLLGKGDLLIIAIVVSIAGIAELVLVVRNTKPAQALWIGLLILGNLFFIAADGLWFGDLSARVLDGKTGDPIASVAIGSTALFIVAAALSSSCVWLAAGAE